MYSYAASAVQQLHLAQGNRPRATGFSSGITGTSTPYGASVVILAGSSCMHVPQHYSDLIGLTNFDKAPTSFQNGQVKLLFTINNDTIQGRHPLCYRGHSPEVLHRRRPLRVRTDLSLQSFIIVRHRYLPLMMVRISAMRNLLCRFCATPIDSGPRFAAESLVMVNR